VAVIAPHGGEIEPHTTLIAEAISDRSFNFYSFSGLIPRRPHGDLHVASTHFREPECYALVSNCKTVVAIHGRKDREEPKTVWIGGLDANLGDAIRDELKAENFSTRIERGDLGGANPENICNQGRSKKGVQLEVPRTLREELNDNKDRLLAFSRAIKTAISRTST
jgi:phage replication-related protein YjqB (UPF0714/DUF867 family)